MAKKPARPTRSTKAKQARAKSHVSALFSKGTVRGAGSREDPCAGACEHFCKEAAKSCTGGVQCGACFSTCQAGGCKTGCKMSCTTGCEGGSCKTALKWLVPGKRGKPAKRKAGTKK
jgi:hypothetical protein